MPPLNMEFFQKCLREAKTPLIALIVLEIAWWVFDEVPGLSALTGDYLYIVRFGLMVWAGYVVVMSVGFTIQAAAVVGALAGLIVEVTDFVLGLILYPGYYSIDYAVAEMIRWMLIGAIAGAVGYLVATNKKDGGESDTSDASVSQA